MDRNRQPRRDLQPCRGGICVIPSDLHPHAIQDNPMKNIALSLLIALAMPATAALAHGPHGHADAKQQIGDLTVSEAFARATPPRAPVGGAYFAVTNAGTTDDRLIDARSPAGAEVQIHTTSEKDGVMSMRRITDGLPVPAGQTVTLAPGGMHLMVMGLTAPLVAGEHVEITLQFEHAGEITLPFEIRALTARGAAGGHDQHGEAAPCPSHEDSKP